MPNRIPQPTTAPRDRAFLVGVEIYQKRNLLSIEDSLSELTLLCNTAGLDVVGQITQKLNRTNPQTLIGSGKVEEIKALVDETLATLVIFDDELNPRHQRELEEELGPIVRVIDRSALILDIFAQHAHTREGQLQVKLAQYEYFLPRLTGRWTHLARQSGGGAGRTGSVGGVGLRGPGETQLEVDRRSIRREIVHLEEELEKVIKHRENYRGQRKKSQIPLIALVGYTNSGKSTLLNRLAKADVYVADQLFATLDPTTRRVNLSQKDITLVTDTVGFIQKLPTTLISAFHATLEEITEADLLLHIVDISHPNAMNQAEAVQKTILEIGAKHIPMLVALNKIDLLPNNLDVTKIVQTYPGSVAISALSGEGIDSLIEKLHSMLFGAYDQISVRLPYKQGQLISLFYECGQIDQIEHLKSFVFIRGKIPFRYSAKYSPWKINQNAESKTKISN
jgi:GTPase